MVAQHYRCDAEPAGHQWAHYSGAGAEPLFLSLIDREARWLWAQDLGGGLIDRLGNGAGDDALLDTLPAVGRDDFDFWTEGDDGARLHHAGHDALTGGQVTIDGVTLERMRFKLETRAVTGRLLIRRKGGEHVSRAPPLLRRRGA